MVIPFVATKGFMPPIFLAENKRAAIHYAKARAAQVESDENIKRKLPDYMGKYRKGYVVYTFKSVPNRAFLKVDPYSPGEPGQWIYSKPMSAYAHVSKVEESPLIVSRDERIRLEAFALTMGWGERNPFMY